MAKLHWQSPVRTNHLILPPTPYISVTEYLYVSGFLSYAMAY